ncbi:glycosyltransferase [Picosynechococcus sp. PCC 73109]|uniref:glycosyltransferase n=1 Tax=Picosynechococcus sp. PCC 73109 TaxID=374982 RepID=UPI0007457C61|nr:glycosyltransferase [Picosynechococcus sp. PCC 73109]AMA09214.1 hypothetical protein AWQ23_07735 [Picosynechococcus sp. PCC 73109]
MKSLVSIIIPCYNAEKWIGEAIESALRQTYSPIEIIVVDDGSTDNSLSAIKKYESKIKWITSENLGVSAARNKGIKISSGDFIQFIDADDYISPGKIQKQLDFLLTSNADIVYGDWCYQYQKSDDEYELSDVKIGEPVEDYIYYTLKNMIPHCSCLYRKIVVERVSGFDESLKIAEDYDFSFRLAFSGAKFAYQSGCHYFYRIHSSTTLSTGQGIKHPKFVELSLDKITALLEENYLLTEKYCYSLAKKYFFTAKNYLNFGELTMANTCYEKSLKLSKNGKFKPDGNSKFETTYRILGWQTILVITRLKAKFNMLKDHLGNFSLFFWIT